MRGIIKSIRKSFRDMDKVLFAVTLFLLILGLFNIVTASSREAVGLDASLYHYFYQHLKFVVVGLIGTIIIMQIPTKDYKPWYYIAYIVIGGFLLYLLFFGTSNRGAKNWVYIPVIGTFQPSELAKPIIIVFLSFLFEEKYRFLRDKKQNHWNVIALILAIGLFFAAIIFLQKDFGTMFIIVSIFGVLFLASPILRSEKFLTIIACLAVVLFASAVLLLSGKHLLSEAQLARFNFFNPCTRYETGGYQTCNGFIAINDGGLFGLGIGKSKQKYSYIPEPHTDSVFAIFAEEWGLITCSIVFFFYIVILKRITLIAARASTLRGKYMALGIATYIFMHILVNLGGLFGVMPLTGVPLPFLSYGGSFTLSLMFSLAIVQRIHIETKNKKINV